MDSNRGDSRETRSCDTIEAGKDLRTVQNAT